MSKLLYKATAPETGETVQLEHTSLTNQLELVHVILASSGKFSARVCMPACVGGGHGGHGGRVAGMGTKH